MRYIREDRASWYDFEVFPTQEEWGDRKRMCKKYNFINAGGYFSHMPSFEKIETDSLDDEGILDYIEDAERYQRLDSNSWYYVIFDKSKEQFMFKPMIDPLSRGFKRPVNCVGYTYIEKKDLRDMIEYWNNDILDYLLNQNADKYIR